MVIGFGSTEQESEAALEKRIRDCVKSLFVTEGYEFAFMPKLVSAADKAVSKMADESREQGDKYKTASEFPERYYYFWSHVLGDANYIVAILSIHHINRRHAWSPDGWALWKREKIVCISVDSIRRELLQAGSLPELMEVGR